MNGVGVNIANLFGDGGKTAAALKALEGRPRIAALGVGESEAVLLLENGTKIRFWDDGQSCCESRYMRTDDDLTMPVGAELVGIEQADGSDAGGPDDEAHEVQFLRIVTSAGVVTIASHNEHNGYYGGFAVRAEVVE